MKVLITKFNGQLDYNIVKECENREIEIISGDIDKDIIKVDDTLYWGMVL